MIGDNFEATWQWVGPDWDDLNNLDTSSIGFIKGDGLGDAESDLDAFIDDLASGDLKLFTGPLNWQDGSEFLADGEEASDFDIWYADQLLAGIVGASSS